MRVWDVSSGQCLRILVGHTNNVTSVAISADGRLALSGSTDQTVRVWDVSSGQCLRTFEQQTSGITSIAISANGRLGLSGSHKTLCMWESGVGKPIAHILAPPISYENAVLFKSIMERARQFFEIGSLKNATAAIQQARQVTGYQHSPAVLDLASRLGRQGQRRMLRSGWLNKIVEVHTAEVSVALSADNCIALVGNVPLAHVWDLRTGQCLRTLHELSQDPPGTWTQKPQPMPLPYRPMDAWRRLKAIIPSMYGI